MSIRFKNIIKTVITYVIWAILLPPFFIGCALIALLPKKYRYDSRLYFLLTSTLSWITIKFAFIKIRIKGQKNLPKYPHSPAIIIANHTSALDIPILEIVTGSYPHVWMSKNGYQNVPLIGFLLHRMHVMVDKATPNSARKALITMYHQLHGGNRHGLLFPEGTRHDDGTIHTFYSGFAVLAQKLRRPIIPIIISGMHTVMPKKSLIIDSCQSNVTINIGKPVYCSEDANVSDFVKEIENYFKQNLD